MRRAALLLCLAGGCAERDNPFDPVNLPRRPAPDEPVAIKVPVPRPHVKVVNLDSTGPNRHNPNFDASFSTALSKSGAGDTIYVPGGVYGLSGAISIINKGSRNAPLVVLAYGGRPHFRLVPPINPSDHLYQLNCLYIEKSHLKMVGFSFSGAQEFAILVGGSVSDEGSLDLDSIQIDSSFQGLNVRNLRGSVRVRNLWITRWAQNEVPVNFQGIARDSLDTASIFW